MSSAYLTYVQDLAELNSSYLTPGQMPPIQVFNAFAWGLVEEMEEFTHAQTYQERLLEAGDVLAYTVLLLLCVASVEEVAEVLVTGVGTKFTHLEFFSNLKRVNREKEKFNWALALSVWQNVWAEAVRFHSFRFEDISTANINKLKARHSKGTMFTGRGDYR